MAQGQWSASRQERLDSKPAPCSSGQALMFGGHVTPFHVGKTLLGLKDKVFRDVMRGKQVILWVEDTTSML